MTAGSKDVAPALAEDISQTQRQRWADGRLTTENPADVRVADMEYSPECGVGGK
jgi:hypothetical protein